MAREYTVNIKVNTQTEGRSIQEVNEAIKETTQSTEQLNQSTKDLERTMERGGKGAEKIKETGTAVKETSSGFRTFVKVAIGLVTAIGSTITVFKALSNSTYLSLRGFDIFVKRIRKIPKQLFDITRNLIVMIQNFKDLSLVARASGNTLDAVRVSVETGERAMHLYLATQKKIITALRRMVNAMANGESAAKAFNKELNLNLEALRASKVAINKSVKDYRNQSKEIKLAAINSKEYTGIVGKLTKAKDKLKVSVEHNVDRLKTFTKNVKHSARDTVLLGKALVSTSTNAEKHDAALKKATADTKKFSTATKEASQATDELGEEQKDTNSALGAAATVMGVNSDETNKLAEKTGLASLITKRWLSNIFALVRGFLIARTTMKLWNAAQESSLFYMQTNIDTFEQFKYVVGDQNFWDNLKRQIKLSIGEAIYNELPGLATFKTRFQEAFEYLFFPEAVQKAKETFKLIREYESLIVGSEESIKLLKIQLRSYLREAGNSNKSLAERITSYNQYLATLQSVYNQEKSNLEQEIVLQQRRIDNKDFVDDENTDLQKEVDILTKLQGELARLGVEYGILEGRHSSLRNELQNGIVTYEMYLAALENARQQFIINIQKSNEEYNQMIADGEAEMQSDLDKELDAILKNNAAVGSDYVSRGQKIVGSFKSTMEGMRSTQQQIEDLDSAHKAGLLKNETDYVAARAFLIEKQKKEQEDFAQFEKDLQTKTRDMYAQSIGAVVSSIGDLGDAMGASAETMKGIRIAEAIINTFAAANMALGSYPPPYNFILMAASIIAGIANVVKIMNTDVGGSGGGAPRGSPAPSIPSPTNAGGTPSISPITSNGTELQKLSQSGSSVTPVKAQVTGFDVTTQQSLDRQVLKNASF